MVSWISYEKCLLIELRKAGLKSEYQKQIIVNYEGEVVGNFMQTYLLKSWLFLNLKSVKNLAKAHEVQLVNYLVATGTNVGLLINFGEDKVEIKRKVRVL